MHLPVLVCSILVVQQSNNSELTQEQAVSLAERFVLENGYTNAPARQIKPKLDGESIEWSSTREDLLKVRFNTLGPKAVGIRKGHPRFESGWSVAFDYVDPKLAAEGLCRVVTFKLDGSMPRVEHKDAWRKFFLGFDTSSRPNHSMHQTLPLRGIAGDFES